MFDFFQNQPWTILFALEVKSIASSELCSAKESLSSECCMGSRCLKSRNSHIMTLLVDQGNCLLETVRNIAHKQRNIEYLNSFRLIVSWQLNGHWCIYFLKQWIYFCQNNTENFSHFYLPTLKNTISFLSLITPNQVGWCMTRSHPTMWMLLLFGCITQHHIVMILIDFQNHFHIK